MGSHGAAAMTGAVLGARTARACDGCMRRRARWHCAADDAFLCQACDASVHSANPLARRHHRVRLPSSSAPSPPRDADEPAWLHGLKRRPRTPRSKLGTKQEPSAVAAAAAASAVPDLEAEDSGIGGGNDHEVDDDDDLLYRVPVFDPMLAELCNPVAEEGEEQEQKPLALMPTAQPSPEFASASASGDADGIAGFDVPDADLASFAADMESLLMGDGGFDDLGFLNDEKPQVNVDLDMEVEAAAPATVCLGEGAQEMEDRKKKADKILKLDYEAVISSWVRDGSSPWFHGERPQLDPGEPWPDFRAASRVAGAAVTAVTGGEREARVSRYREKRRTRLFAKKIRYEVRKLNAEKRPRMKGRFVKRTSFPLPPPPQVPMMLAAPPVGHGRFRF